jgi:hypothetical protein
MTPLWGKRLSTEQELEKKSDLGGLSRNREK